MDGLNRQRQERMQPGQAQQGLAHCASTGTQLRHTRRRPLQPDPHVDKTLRIHQDRGQPYQEQAYLRAARRRPWAQGIAEAIAGLDAKAPWVLVAVLPEKDDGTVELPDDRIRQVFEAMLSATPLGVPCHDIEGDLLRAVFGAGYLVAGPLALPPLQQGEQTLPALGHRQNDGERLYLEQPQQFDAEELPT